MDVVNTLTGCKVKVIIRRLLRRPFAAKSIDKSAGCRQCFLDPDVKDVVQVIIRSVSGSGQDLQVFEIKQVAADIIQSRSVGAAIRNGIEALGQFAYSIENGMFVIVIQVELEIRRLRVGFDIGSNPVFHTGGFDEDHIMRRALGNFLHCLVAIQFCCRCAYQDTIIGNGHTIRFNSFKKTQKFAHQKLKPIPLSWYSPKDNVPGSLPDESFVLFPKHCLYRWQYRMLRHIIQAEELSKGRRYLPLIELPLCAGFTKCLRVRSHCQDKDLFGIRYLRAMAGPLAFYLVASAMIASDQKGRLIPVLRDRLYVVPEAGDQLFLGVKGADIKIITSGMCIVVRFPHLQVHDPWLI